MKKIQRYLNGRMAVIWLGRLLRYILLIGLCFIILYPFLAKIFASFMTEMDTVDPTVRFLSRDATLSNYIYIWEKTSFLKGMRNTFLLSAMYALLTVISCACVGYGLAKFRLRFAGIVVVLIVFTMLVPPQTVMLPMYSYFRFFDPYHIVSLITGAPVKLNDTVVPMAMLGITGFGFRAGLFTLIFRQFFTGVPDQLIEAAYVDGSGVMRTFLRIVAPLSLPVTATVFLFSFCWQWTDIFYSSLLYNEIPLLTNVILNLSATFSSGAAMSYLSSIIVNTGVLLIVLPLLLLFSFFQKGFIQGVERSGIVE